MKTVKTLVMIFFIFLIMSNTNLSFAEDLNNSYNIYNYSLKRSTSFKIPVREASGIASDYRNNYLFIHEDSNNPPYIYVFDEKGNSINRIDLENAQNYDWEDITTDHNGTFWIINSRKSIIEFKTDPQANLLKDSVKTYTLPKELKGINVESLDYLPDENKFVAIYKGKPKSIYKFALGDKNAEYLGQIEMSIKPSGLTHHPITENFFVIAFRGHKIVEYSKDFKKVLGTFHIPLTFQFQPEGIEFDKDLNLIFASEKNFFSTKGKSKLTILKKPDTKSINKN